jgi:hypothetical protein
MNGQRDIEIDRWTNGQTDYRADGQLGRHRLTGWHTYGQMDRQTRTDEQTNRNRLTRTDEQTNRNRWTDWQGQMNRQIKIKRHNVSQHNGLNRANQHNVILSFAFYDETWKLMGASINCWVWQSSTCPTVASSATLPWQGNLFLSS